jgi:cation:H+ antiporter
MFVQFVLLSVGLALLWGGAELLIRNSSALARALGVSPMIIGLTVVSIGTSLPEFVVSLMAALQNTMGMSIGNIVGSNIANICLILGVGAFLTNLKVKKSWVYKEVPFMIIATIVFLFFTRTKYILERWEGLLLLGFLVLFLTYLSRASVVQMLDFSENIQNNSKTSINRKLFYLFLAIVGMGILISGSRITVQSGTALAIQFGVSDIVIGLTLIALGTSLPELATTIVGAIQKETDIVVGNVIGSNIFNLLFIGGAVATLKQLPIPPNFFGFEIIFLLGSSILIWPFMRYQWNIHRIEGSLLLILYFTFIGLTFISQ